MGNSTAHDLVIEGIEKWEGSYWVFGHVMGVDDGYADTSGSTIRPTAAMLAADDVMVNNHLKSAKVSSLDVQMMVMATSKNEWQYFYGI